MQKRHALPIMTSPGITLIGEKPIRVFKSGKLQAMAIQALAEKFPMAAALTMMDLSVEAEAFGASIQFSEMENPNVVTSIVHDADEVKRLVVPTIGTARTAECLTAARLCAENIKDRPTLGGLIGPFSLAGRLLDMSKMMLQTATEPTVVHALLEKTTRFLIDYALAFKQSGCGGLIMAEPAAGLVSPKMSKEFSYNYVKRVVDAVQDDSFTFILHNCGKTEKMVSEMLSTGASAIHVGNAVDVTKILEQVPCDYPVMGNLDPSGIFLMGTSDVVFQATAGLLAKTKEHPNFVISSGCDIPPGTPIANIEAFFKAVGENGNC
ncbi:MAG: uroporphyrinogen decarboxylase family protein [Thermoguttaceae bacterium]